jgi:hypothetical protein
MDKAKQLVDGPLFLLKLIDESLDGSLENPSTSIVQNSLLAQMVFRVDKCRGAHE